MKLFPKSRTPFFSCVVALGLALSAIHSSGANAATFNYRQPVIGLTAPAAAAPAQPVIPVSDPYWLNTILAMNAEDGLIDVTGKQTVSVIGAASASTAQKQFGNQSISVSGGTSYLTLPASVMTSMLTAPAWTMEFFFNANAVGGEQFIVSQGAYAQNHQFALILASNSSFLVLAQNGSANWRVNTPVIAPNSWHHVALVMANGTLSLFLDGALQGSTPKAFTTSGSNPVTIGTSAFNNPAYAPFSGYIDDLRMTTVARYTSNFTVPTESFPTR